MRFLFGIFLVFLHVVCYAQTVTTVTFTEISPTSIQQIKIAEKTPAHCLNTARLIRGDYGQLRAAFNADATVLLKIGNQSISLSNPTLLTVNPYIYDDQGGVTSLNTFWKVSFT